MKNLSFVVLFMALLPLSSMMRFNDSPFNAPSREAIYKYVMQESEGPSWQYDYNGTWKDALKNPRKIVLRH